MTKDRIFLALLPIFAFTPPVLQAYAANNIKLFSAPALAYFSGIALIAAFIGLALALLYSNTVRWRGMLTSAGLAGVVLITTDLVAGGLNVISAMPLPHGRRLVILAVFVLLASIFWMIRSHAPKILFIGAAAFFGSTVFLSPGVFFPQPRPANRGLLANQLFTSSSMK